MILFEAIVAEMRSHFSSVHPGWGGAITWVNHLTVQLRKEGQRSILKVSCYGDDIHISEHGYIDSVKFVVGRFRLGEPDSVERLLARFDEWVEANK